MAGNGSVSMWSPFVSFPFTIEEGGVTWRQTQVERFGDAMRQVSKSYGGTVGRFQAWALKWKTFQTNIAEQRVVTDGPHFLNALFSFCEAQSWPTCFRAVSYG